jgi:hypothetical protein
MLMKLDAAVLDPFMADCGSVAYHPDFDVTQCDSHPQCSLLDVNNQQR